MLGLLNLRPEGGRRKAEESNDNALMILIRKREDRAVGRSDGVGLGRPEWIFSRNEIALESSQGEITPGRLKIESVDNRNS